MFENFAKLHSSTLLEQFLTSFQASNFRTINSYLNLLYSLDTYTNYTKNFDKNLQAITTLAEAPKGREVLLKNVNKVSS